MRSGQRESRALRRAAAAAARRWGQLRVGTLQRNLQCPLGGELQLPLRTILTTTTTPAGSTPPPCLSLELQTNSTAVLDWWRLVYFGFFRPTPACKPHAAPSADATKDTDDAGSSSETAPLPVLATSSVKVHHGAPPGMGYPTVLEMEARHWAEAALQEEQRSLAPLVGNYDAMAMAAGAPPLTPVRWLQQLLLDGFVSQRVSAAAATTRAFSRRSGSSRESPRAPYHASPYYAGDELGASWALFGEPYMLTPSTDASPHASSTSLHSLLLHASSAPGAAALAAPAGMPEASAPAEDHLQRVAELALARAVLPSLGGVWLRGAVVSHATTGASVLILGPRRCGKTTLALHCLSSPPAAAAAAAAVTSSNDHSTAASPLRLTAADSVLLSPAPWCPADGDTAASSAGRHCLLCSLPGLVPVGLGAVLGTLCANTALAAHLQPPLLRDAAAVETLLRNTDGVLWRMAPAAFHVHVTEAFGPGAWQPAVMGPLAGVVWLDWDVDSLSLPTGDSRAPDTCRVRPMGTMEEGGVGLLVDRLGDAPGGLFRGHYLLRGSYDESRAAEYFEDVFSAATSERGEQRTTPLVLVEGQVHFPSAVRLVRRLLGVREE